MYDLTRAFYQHLASGKGNIPDPVKLPSVGTLAQFEAIIAEVENMSDEQCRLMLGETLKLMLAQQKLLEEVMRPKF